MLTDHGRNVYRITIHNSDTDDKRFVYVVGDIAMSDVLPLFESDPHNLGKIEFVAEVKMMLGFVLEEPLPYRPVDTAKDAAQ